MLKLENISISGMSWDGNCLWIAAPEERLVATYNPLTRKAEEKLIYSHEVCDVCSGKDGLWLLAAGGSLGLQIVLWSLDQGVELHKIKCPDGAGAGLALHDGKLWLPHRHNRKLFCLDPKSGKTNWVIRTRHETFSPTTYKNELWLIESDPGPLGHWSEARQAKFFFSRYDPVHERIVEQIPLSFVPSCMAFDGERFYYAEYGRRGFSSAKKNSGQL